MVASVERRFNPNHLVSVKLNASHYRELVHKLGLNPDWVQINCQSVDAKAASEHLGYKVYSSPLILEGGDR